MSDSSGKSNHYIDGDRMSALAAQARDTKEFDSELLEMFYVLADKSYHRGMRAVLERDDAKQEAVLACYNATSAYEGGSAYSYYRRVIHGRWNELKRNSNRQKARPGEPILDIDEVCDPAPEDCIDYSHYREGSLWPRAL